ATLVFTRARAPDRTRNRSNYARLRLRARAGIKNGWVTERSIVHAWKACVPKGTGGSNPPPSAMLIVGSVWIDSAIHAEKVRKMIRKSLTLIPECRAWSGFILRFSRME